MTMTRVRKILAGAAVAVAVAGGTSLAGAGTAQAGGWGCGGYQLDQWDINSGGTTLSQVHLYYNPSNGMNCAVNVKVGQFYGRAGRTEMYIASCLYGGPGHCSDEAIAQDWDGRDDYKYYAGPVQVYGAGHCIALVAKTFSTVWSLDTKYCR